MDCPYCNAEITPNVISCKACGRDLSVVRPLMDACAELKSRLDDLEGKFERFVKDKLELDSNINSTLPGDLPQTIEAEVGDRWLRYALVIIGGAASLIAAHAIFVIWLDLPIFWLRLISLVIPAMSGFFSSSGIGRPSLWAIPGAALFGGACIFGMSAVLSYIDGTQLTPSNSGAWREVLIYGLSISASFFAGILARHLFSVLRKSSLSSLDKVQSHFSDLPKKVRPDAIKTAETMLVFFSTLISGFIAVVSGIYGILK